MSPANVIDMLTEDHKQVLTMFEEFERSSTEQRDRLVHEIIQSLTTHTSVEEEVLYPFIRAEVPDGNQLMDEAEREHQEAKDAMEALRDLSPDDPSFEDAFRTLKEGLQHHIEEEEGEVFPKLTQVADEPALVDLGRTVAQARAMRPRGDRPAG